MKLNLIASNLLTITLLALCSCTKSKDPVDNPIPTPIVKLDHAKCVLGADLSYANALQSIGSTFTDAGIKSDVYKIFSSNGCNLIRVRLWNNPATWQSQLYGKTLYSNLEDVTETISKAKANNMAVLLDLHYSDDWADPSKQYIPKAWESKSFNIVKDSVYQYTLKVLNHLHAKNLVPEYIQIGNETNDGMIHPHGKIVNNDFTKFAELLSSGLKAVKDFNLQKNYSIKTMIHVAQLQNVEWWLKGISKHNIFPDVDFIGLSHYFKWSEIHTMENVTSSVKNVTTLSGKPAMIIETAFPWSAETKDSYQNIIGSDGNKTNYPITQKGQEQYLIDLTQAVINGGGKGVIYWEPAWVSNPNFKDRWGVGSSWENCALFDFQNETNSGFSFYSHKYTF